MITIMVSSELTSASSAKQGDLVQSERHTWRVIIIILDYGSMSKHKVHGSVTAKFGSKYKANGSVATGYVNMIAQLG